MPRVGRLVAPAVRVETGGLGTGVEEALNAVVYLFREVVGCEGETKL